VWAFAARHGLAIASKDSDFQQRALLRGHPPKVIWVRLGNCTTAEIAALLRERHEDVLAFAADPTASFLVLWKHEGADQGRADGGRPVYG
jgi:predicted nuclease of predicted toxin-antitoxin system